MKPKRGSGPKCAEEKPLRPLKEERPLRSFNSQVAREEFSDVWNAETDSDDELSSWDEDVEYRSCKYTRSFCGEFNFNFCGIIRPSSAAIKNILKS